ncbi:hypothetical protein WN982_22770 [Paraburkholderia sp. IMGN_8]|uniref:hypothetical protein n=1 Tax=Paraburkholderia sp. IMGN_8 TaxID=3136564 RepID=UPI00310163C3
MLSNSLRLASSAGDALGARLKLRIQVWAERKLKICVRSVKDLPPFARVLVDRLMAGV